MSRDYVGYIYSVMDEVTLAGLGGVIEAKTSVGQTAVAFKLAEAKLLDDKNQDYGPNNIKEIGILGVCSRIRDKVARIENITRKQQEVSGSVVINESLEDAAMDIANYGTIIHLVLKDLWH